MYFDLLYELLYLINNFRFWPTVVFANRKFAACKSAWVTAKPDTDCVKTPKNTNITPSILLYKITELIKSITWNTPTFLKTGN